MSDDSIDVVAQPRWSAVRAAMKLLTAVADARTTEAAEARFDQLEDRAEKSIAFTNAAYLAAQILRDMDVLSQGEAAHVFRELFDLRSDEYSRNDPYHEAHLNAYVKEMTERPSAADSETRVDHLERELLARTNVLEARFHRARGEVGLAELVVRDPDTALHLAAEGQCSLMLGKLGSDDDDVDEPNPAVVAAICERIAALATADTTRETVARYSALAAALVDADVASGMAAVRELRLIGLVSFAESVGLLTHILDPLVYAEIEIDRACVRLQARIEEVSGDEAEEPERRSSSEKVRRVQDALQRRLDARARLLIAMCLRRFGEHEAATLLVEHPKEFKRLEEMSLGAWGGPRGSEESGGGSSP